MTEERRALSDKPPSLAVSRRTTLTAGGIGLAAAAGLISRSVAAQPAELPEVIAAFLAGWEALDADLITGTFAENGVREDAAAGTTIQGKAEIRRSLTDFFAAFSDATVQHPVAFAAQDHAVDEWIFAGNYTGMLPGFPQGAGQPMTIRGLTLIEYAADGIRRTIDFYDTYGMLVQSGAVPPLEAAATPAATPEGG